MQQQDFINSLNRLLNDSNNFALTLDQKTSIVQEAMADNYAVTPVWDNSLTFSISSYQYALPATITAVSDVYLERDVSQFPEAIGRELWEVIAGNLQFNNIAHWTIPDTYPLWLKGFYKVKSTDTVTDVNLQNYIISLSGWIALRDLMFTKIGSFLRNDTTVAELLNTRKEAMGDVMEYRRQLSARDFIAI
jgi:hypothetical protein